MFLLKHCFAKIVFLTFLRLDCSHFNQSPSWLMFLLGLKKKKKSWEMFETSHSSSERKAEELWKPQKAHSLATSQALWQYNTHRYTLCQKHPTNSSRRSAWQLMSLNVNWNTVPRKRLHLSQQLNLSAISLIGNVSHVLFREKRGGYSMRVHYLARAHMHVCDGSSSEILIPYLSADTECVWFMKVGPDNFQI